MLQFEIKGLKLSRKLTLHNTLVCILMSATFTCSITTNPLKHYRTYRCTYTFIGTNCTLLLTAVAFEREAYSI